MTKYRSNNCGELTIKHINQEVKLSGWVNKKRDHGGLLFIDLRDHYGITQCVIENDNKLFPLIEKIKPDSVSMIYMLFPDPWQKIKHSKRRLLKHIYIQDL